MNHVIPGITDPLGRHWHQPDRADILVDDKHALMTQATFDHLHEYSGTIPSGVYNGKMWKRHDGIYEERNGVRFRRPNDCKWLLMWYADSSDPNQCSLNHREILIA